jgi:hypothetical protein
VTVHICPISRIAANLKFADFAAFPAFTASSQPVHSPFTGAGTGRIGRPKKGLAPVRNGCRAGNSASQSGRPDRPQGRSNTGAVCRGAKVRAWPLCGFEPQRPRQDETSTSTDMPANASVDPTKLPTTGIASRMPRATATGIRLNPPTPRLVGSKVIQPAPLT